MSFFIFKYHKHPKKFPKILKIWENTEYLGQFGPVEISKFTMSKLFTRCTNKARHIMSSNECDRFIKNFKNFYWSMKSVILS